MNTLKVTKKTPIAVIGVSGDPDKYGHKVFRDLLNAKYNVIGINPKGQDILGQKIYSDLHDLPFIPELVIIVVKPETTEEIVEQIKDIGIHTIWMQPGSESEKAIEIVRGYGINVIANACFMIDQGLWK